MLKQQSQPLGMFEALGLGLGLEVAEGRGHAVQVEILQQIEGRMREVSFSGSSRDRGGWDGRSPPSRRRAASPCGSR